MALLSLLILLLQILITRPELINNPTLKPVNPFSASADADVLKTEIKYNSHRNRDKLVDLWFHRTYDQRRQMEECYNKDTCGGWFTSNDQKCPLSTAFKTVSDNSMDNLYSDSLLPPGYLLGRTVYEVIIGEWKENGAIEEILCGNDKKMKDRINEYFQTAYKDTVENQLSKLQKDDQDYQHVMQKYCLKGLCQEKKLKPEDVDKEANALRSIDPNNDKEGFKKKLLELLDNNCEPTVYEVIIGEWKENGAIEEILCGNDKKMKDRINEYFQTAYKDTVENQLSKLQKDDQDYQHVMQKYCLKGLCQEKKLKPEDVDKEANALRSIDPNNDKEGFKKKLLELLDNNCEPDMKSIFEKYRQDKDGIENATEKVFREGGVERAYFRLVKYIENTCKYYADELYAAVDGYGTDIDKINRIILTRCERDLGCILKKYEDLHGETFTRRLRGDTIENRYHKSIQYLCGKT